MYDHDVPAAKQLIKPDDFVSFAVDPLGASTPDAALSEEERCCIDRLLAHLNSNAPYYGRAIWLAEDPDARAIRFADVPDRDGVTLLDVIENRPIAVLCDFVRYLSREFAR